MGATHERLLKTALSLVCGDVALLWWMSSCAVFHRISALLRRYRKGQASPIAGGQAMNYHNDDGSTFGGIVFVACLIIAFCAGYTLRDQGITFKVQAPQVQRGVK